MIVNIHKIAPWLMALLLFVVYSLTAPKNHSEAEDVYHFAAVVERGHFADQAGVNRMLALPVFGVAYKTAQALGYHGRAFPFMIFINRVLAVAAVFLFWKLLCMKENSRGANGRSREHASSSVPILGASSDDQRSTINNQLPAALLLAFSYGFWRYANEAETYILASVLVLGAWCLAVKGRWVLCVGVSALGILVHLLNLVPLLLIIPLYYLLSGTWKRAVLHGLMTGLLVGLGYTFCFHILDWGNLGAHDQPIESGLSPSNLLRGGVAFGQCLVSGNFLFGFEWFRDLLVHLFPSRMLGEEFYMAQHMSGWIKWAGCVTLIGFVVCGLWFAVFFVRTLFRKTRANTLTTSSWNPDPKALSLNSNAFAISCWIWLMFYALAVIHTEAGSPELWIMGLIPFWLVVAPLISRSFLCFLLSLRENFFTRPSSFGTGSNFKPPISNLQLFSPLWLLVAVLVMHNLVGGLFPVMSRATDYHVAKGEWLVEHTTSKDVILTDYEPVMIFYLDYFALGTVISSGSHDLDNIKQLLTTGEGNAYAVASFFHSMPSMQVRDPRLYARMAATGEALRPDFEKVDDDEFGGIYRYRK